METAAELRVEVPAGARRRVELEAARVPVSVSVNASSVRMRVNAHGITSNFRECDCERWRLPAAYVA